MADLSETPVEIGPYCPDAERLHAMTNTGVSGVGIIVPVDLDQIVCRPDICDGPVEVERKFLWFKWTSTACGQLATKQARTA